MVICLNFFSEETLGCFQITLQCKETKAKVERYDVLSRLAYNLLAKKLINKHRTNPKQGNVMFSSSILYETLQLRVKSALQY